jgi:prolyl oligopeptidase
MHPVTPITLLILLPLACATQGKAGPKAATGSARPHGDAPSTRVDNVVEEMHGVRVSDPYRWLEDGSKPEVQEWVRAQNRYLRSKLDELAIGKPIRERIEELMSIGTLSTPEARYPRHAPLRLFFTRREGKQNQPVLYVRDGLRGTDRVLVDVNALSAQGTDALDWWVPSKDGKLVAYGVSPGGSEWSTLRVREVDSGKDLADVVERTRACSLAWRPDGRGFYYTRYPKPGAVPEGEENYHRHVFAHTLGTDPAADPVVFGAGRDPKDWPNVALSPDGKRLLVVVWQGWAKSEMYLLDAAHPGAMPVPVAEKIDAIFDGTLLDDRLFVRTNDGAPNYRLFAVDPKRPERPGWREIVPASGDVLDGAAVVGRRLVATYLHQAHSQARLFDLDGKAQGEVALPAIGTVTGVGGEWDGPDLFVGFTSFAVPPEVHHREMKSGATEIWERVSAPLDTGAYEVEQVFYPSSDGTEVSMFLVHRKGLRKDGIVPTVLYGYGGFNISLTPQFTRAAFLLLEHGGLYAVANLRGGGEYGEAWHQAGMRGHKQNVFDDFLAAADWIVEHGYTTPDRMAISGRSNGGLLVAAAITQRPRRFRAALCDVPLTDMLRYHRFLIAKLWIPELGSADDPEAFQWLSAYSPYHHVEDGRDYPAVLVSTGEGDSRVEPSHARKFAARLQAATASGHPVLLRTDFDAGHGQGKPLAKLIDEAADEWTFLFWQLGITP